MRDRKIVENNGIPEYATYADLPLPGNYTGLAYIQDEGSLRRSNGVEWYGDGSSALISGRPSAASFGKGEWRVGDTVYRSNGVFWKAITNQIPRMTPLKVAMFGDSTANTGTYTSNDNCEVIDLAFPSSGQTTASSVDSTRYMLHMEYPVARLARNCAVAGQTLVQMIARDTAVASATRKAASDISSANIDVIIARMGINDISALTSFAAADTDPIIANYKIMLGRLISTGAAVISEGVAGYHNVLETSGNAKGIQQAVVTVNNAIRTHIEGLNNPKVIFQDPVGVTCDENAVIYPNYSTDGIHFVMAGAIAIAKAEAVTLTQLFGPSANIQYPGTNLFVNPVLANTGAVASGTAATGITLPTDDAWKDLTASAIEIIDGVPFQVTTVTQNGGGANSITFTCAVDLTAMAIVSGDVWGMEFDYFVRKVDGTNLPSGATFNAIFKVTKSTAGTVSNTPLASTTSTGMSELKGHVVFNKLKINEASANLTTPLLTFTWYPLIGDAIAANAVKMGIGGIRIVKQ